MCSPPLNFDRGIQLTPSPPIWIKPSVSRSIQLAMKVTADPGQRSRALGYFGRRIVRAAGAEVGHAFCPTDLDYGAGLAPQPSARLGKPVAAEFVVKAPRDDRHKLRRGQFADPWHELLTILVRFADHAFRLAARIVVKVLLELAFDDAAFLLDDEHFVLALHEVERASRLQRPDHADLVNVDADASRFFCIDAEQSQCLHQVEVRLFPS